MTAPFTLVDAFAHGPFTGNPAGVVLLESAAEEAWMQSVAAEINHAETAFCWPLENGYSLRWFTPTVEVDLCGHATLATRHVLHEEGLVEDGTAVNFLSKSGPLVCTSADGVLSLDFPSVPVRTIDAPVGFEDSVPVKTVAVMRNDFDWYVELENESAVLEFQPDMAAIARVGLRGVCLTATAESIKADFVSRFFAPASGVPEDHVTGSAHCALGPYWGEKLGLDRLTGYQASKRGGFVGIQIRGDRTILSGQARSVVRGTLTA